MTAAIEHRGPDEDGHFVEPGVALGMRRLSIIDLGRQPAAGRPTRTARCTAVFNGEIYNFRELRERARGARPPLRHRRRHARRSSTSTRSTGRASSSTCAGCSRSRSGTRRRRRLVLARDRMGVKPLYYAETEAGLAFASEIKSLLAGGLVAPRARPGRGRALPGLRLRAGPADAVRGRAQARRPRCLLVWQDGQVVEQRSTGRPGSGAPATSGRSWEEDGERLLELLRTATRAPDGQRRAARRDAQRRPRLEPDHGADGRGLRPARADLLGRLRRGRRAPTSSAEARAVASRLGTDHHELVTSALRPSRPARRRPAPPRGADRRPLLRRLAAAQPAGPRDRHRGALGPGRGRAARRLPQAPGRPRRRSPRPGAAGPRRGRAGGRGGGAGVGPGARPQGALGRAIRSSGCWR